MVVFRLFEKLRYSNVKSIKFQSLKPLITKFSPQNTVFNPTISVFGCHEAK